ncbi:MAG: exopolyphosphatase, partial [Nitrospinota bacterium]|nr:exopolyphosphatase [Nitrospinota bacterium]
MSAREKYRLITRHDFDGLVSAILLKELGMIGEIEFAHPKDMQDDKVAVTAGDITTNLPYTEGVHLAFDHHLSEAHRLEPKKNFILDPDAPSAARVVYNHFGGRDAFPEISGAMMTAVDRADAA